MSDRTMPALARKRFFLGYWMSGLLAIAWVALAGCNHSDSLPSLRVYQVKGKVLLADGKPLSSGWVYFVPKGDLTLTPSAEIQTDGTFSLMTGGSGEGALPGEYKVRVETPQLPQPKAKSGKKPVIPFKYSDEDSSGLVAVVRAEPNQIDPIILK